MKCLVFAEKASRPLAKSTRDIVGRLHALGHSVQAAALAANDDEAQTVAQALASCGANEVVVDVDVAFATYDPGQWGEALFRLFEHSECEAVLLAHTFAGRELAARFAQRVDAPLASDVIAIDELAPGESVTHRAVHGGKAYEVVRTEGSPAVISVRPGAWRSGEVAAMTTSITTCDDVDPGAPMLEMVAFSERSSSRPSLDEADVVVAVGRGCSAAAREYAGELADLLGAALGSSRGMVDSGLEGYETQVGQTGKTVAPQLYIACGISGSIQHQAGMARSTYIVAINTDESAPIFDIADLGVQADAEDTLRALVEQIKTSR